ncbi:hypothetical protein HK096_010313, partial [Nowakowskiella sp. JEL0078]
LERFGYDGNAVSVGQMARTAGISVGTMILYTNRVIKALLILEKEFIQWPDPVERQNIACRIKATFGFPNCIGIVDGTHINFAQ